MTPRQWRLLRQVEAIVNRDVARTDADLARILGTTVTELRVPIAVLMRQGKVTRCMDYVVAVPPSDVVQGAA